MTPRVRVAVAGLEAGEQRLDEKTAHYLTRVHRLKPGDRFVAFDPEARTQAVGEILTLEGRALSCRFAALAPGAAELAVRVTVLQCLGKGDKLDSVVRAATALGVRALVVVESERSVARLDAERGAQRAERWRAVALDAARQSGRGDVPPIEGPLSLAAALDGFRDAQIQKLCLDPHAERPLGSALDAGGTRELALLIGPEGGFSDDELELAERAGFMRVRLGPYVLRTELAGAAALGAVLAVFER